MPAIITVRRANMAAVTLELDSHTEAVCHSLVHIVHAQTP